MTKHTGRASITFMCSHDLKRLFYSKLRLRKLGQSSGAFRMFMKVMVGESLPEIEDHYLLREFLRMLVPILWEKEVENLLTDLVLTHQTQFKDEASDEDTTREVLRAGLE